MGAGTGGAGCISGGGGGTASPVLTASCTNCKYAGTSGVRGFSGSLSCISRTCSKIEANLLASSWYSSGVPGAAVGTTVATVSSSGDFPGLSESLSSN